MVPPRNLRLMVSFFKLSISNKKQIFFISLFSMHNVFINLLEKSGIHRLCIYLLNFTSPIISQPIPIHVIPMDIPSETPKMNWVASEAASCSWTSGRQRPTKSSSKPMQICFIADRSALLLNTSFKLCSLTFFNSVSSISFPAINSLTEICKISQSAS